jgi:hypothetical protein
MPTAVTRCSCGAHFSAMSANAKKSSATTRPAGTQAPTQK